MKSFEYSIKGELGLHARPAGLLNKMAKSFDGCVVTVSKDGKSAKASQLIKLMSLGIKKGDNVTVSVEGDDEAAAADALKAFFEENL